MNELTMAIINTGEGYQARREIGRMIARDKLSTAMRLQFWSSVVSIAANRYTRQFGEKFTMKTLMETVAELDAHYKNEAIENGEAT